MIVGLKLSGGPQQDSRADSCSPARAVWTRATAASASSSLQPLRCCARALKRAARAALCGAGEAARLPGDASLLHRIDKREREWELWGRRICGAAKLVCFGYGPLRTRSAALNPQLAIVTADCSAHEQQHHRRRLIRIDRRF